MPQVLRLGFAGLGMAVTRIFDEKPGIAQLPYIRITAAADLRKDASERFQQEFNAEVYDSVEEMCQSPHVDAVYIATPPELHARHAIIAAENRKHVIVEKPMALSLEEAAAMNTAAEKNGIKLLAGHTHSFDPPIRKMREIVWGGELGKLCMINTWNYNDFMYRPWPSRELATSRGVILNQGPHQVDIVRLLGGGMVRSVRAMTGVWDRSRPPEGAYICYLEFEEGVPATLVYSGYGFFDTAELFWWIGEGGQPRDPETNLKMRENLKRMAGPEMEKVLDEQKGQMRYGAQKSGKWPEIWKIWGRDHGSGDTKRHQKFFGLTLVTCEKGDMRQSPDGIFLYGNEGKKEISVAGVMAGRQAEVTELYEAVVNDRPLFHDGRWGEATLEVCLAIIQSAAERREMYLSHQVPTPDI